MQNQNIESILGIVEARYRTLLVLTILSAVAFVAMGAQNSRTGGLIEKVDTGVIQVGMMIPYFGRTLPKGYVWADGIGKWPDADWVPDHLRSNKEKGISHSVPNLKDKFLCGVKEIKELGKTGGTNSVSGLDITVPEHLHTLPATSGFVTANGANPGGAVYQVRDNGNRFDTDHHFAVDGGPGNEEGNHSHDLGGQTSLKESQKIGLPAIPIIPEYVSVRYIIRIE